MEAPKKRPLNLCQWSKMYYARRKPKGMTELRGHVPMLFTVSVNIGERAGCANRCELKNQWTTRVSSSSGYKSGDRADCARLRRAQ